ncbi:hypothetical protein EYF80_065372 [Liparis tanakae]|uniref:Uncharacterized protein n=1 Tax=Liparis tanakae TaxID=230148 RepID=A0A4Z2E873_9TELE|nr:hypothetical protein EYF80_065372 [Liparis tanakae]
MSHVSGNSSGVAAPPLPNTSTSCDPVTPDPPKLTSTGPLLLNNKTRDITSCSNSTGGDAGVRTVEITRDLHDIIVQQHIVEKVLWFSMKLL